MSRWFYVVILSGFIAGVGCEQKPSDPTGGKVTSEDVRRDADKAVETATEFSQQKKDEFQKDLEVRMKDLDGEFAKLREKGRDLKDEAKIKWEQKMADLETKREAARAKLTEVGNSSAEAWKDVQKGAQSAWEDLDKAFREAAKEF